MAGAKKKKSAKGPARPIATTSIASKPRAEAGEGTPDGEDSAPAKTGGNATGPEKGKSADDPGQTASPSIQKASENKTAELSPEEFEKQLEESELQLLVEKYAQKVRRDVQRQKQRLETERRLLRSQATSINTVRWLPLDVMDQILDLIQAENRFAATSLSSESPAGGKLVPEEEATIRLWTLENTLLAVGMPQEKVRLALRHVLELGPNVSAPGKDSIWGLDETFAWLARECPNDELPDYDGRGKSNPSTKALATSLDSPFPSRPDTPDFSRPGKNGGRGKSAPSKAQPTKKKIVVSCDSDIEPDELVPQWVETKEKAYRAERASLDSKRDRTPDAEPDAHDLEMAKLEARLAQIEADPLYDKYVGEQQWRARRVVVEKELAQARRQRPKEEKPSEPVAEPDQAEVGTVNDEAERIAKDVLAEAEDVDLSDLFEVLPVPVSEVDAVTGKTQAATSSGNGIRIIIRDFEKWTGISPSRVLEEACRARDNSCKITYSLVSEASYSNRYRVVINWGKPQEIPPETSNTDVEVFAHPLQFAFTMHTVATPDQKQSESYAATWALYHIFSLSPKEEKVSMRLPPVWRELWFELAEERKNRADARDRGQIRELREMVRKKREQEDEDGIILPGAFKGRGTPRTTQGDGSEDAGLDRPGRNSHGPEYYQQIWIEKSNGRRFQTMLQSRMQLPMWAFRQQVLDAVDNNQVVIICGETGCGKSTQTPSFLLEHELSRGKPCKIYCTEPRRISALSLARRVSEELGESRNDLGTSRSLVGYSIRLESNTSRETRLVYATTGIVMRMLEGSNDLSEITHLILDEVHERSIDSDFLLIVLKKLMVQRLDLKVVLMSATVDAERFSKYLGGAPVLNVPGRTFPVQVRYLEDVIAITGYQVGDAPPDKMLDLDDDGLDDDGSNNKTDAGKDAVKSLSRYSPQTRRTLLQMDEYRIDPDLIVELITKIATDPGLVPYSSAILVFLPGIAEIRTLNDLLSQPFFASGWRVYPLHSSISTEDQEEAFLVPPPGVRKIVLATNIAETGITIPDVTCVIDTGKHKEMRYDERRQLSRLLDCFISRANAKQRRGRAGRVQEGLCFHLFTKHRHDNLMNDQQTPEMLRLSLQDLAIRVKVCKIGGIEKTLGDALDPPSAKNIRRAIDALVDVRALTAGEDLTPLGRQLARLPLDVFLGKLVLQATVLGCLDMALTVAAILSSRSPFSAPFGQRAQADAARVAFRRADSDLLTIYNAYLAWKRVCQSAGGLGKDFQFCRKNYLSSQTLSNIEDVKGQLLVALADSGFLPLTTEERQALSRLRFGARGRRQQVFFEVPQRVNLNSDNDAITASVIASSFYPKLLVRDPPGSKCLRNVGNNQAISLHPTSVNKGRLDIEWLSYYHIMQAKQVYRAHETTAVDPFAIALLCGDVRCELFSGVMILDGNRGRFLAPDWKTILVVKVLRTRLREMLARSFRQPGKGITAQHQRWLDIWQKIFAIKNEPKETVGTITVTRA